LAAALFLLARPARFGAASRAGATRAAMRHAIAHLERYGIALRSADLDVQFRSPPLALGAASSTPTADSAPACSRSCTPVTRPHQDLGRRDRQKRLTSSITTKAPTTSPEAIAAPITPPRWWIPAAVPTPMASATARSTRIHSLRFRIDSAYAWRPPDHAGDTRPDCGLVSVHTKEVTDHWQIRGRRRQSGAEQAVSHDLRSERLRSQA
jgi:hypothetical protein